VAGEILVVNAGSTSLKLAAIDDDGNARPVAGLSDPPSDVVAVAHRIVHGGDRFREPAVVNEAVERALEELSELAPLHNAPAVRAMREARRVLPEVPHVAVFDTAFHATLPAWASTYALPRELREQFGVRRYGFHGLSVQWSSEQVRVPRLVVCHLGGGCSVTAVRDGRSVDTSMGFSPLEGVPMATRSGSVDPGALLHLIRVRSLTLEQLSRLLEHHSGLAGLSGISGSVQALEASTSPAAAFALSVYAYRIAGAVASMAVALGGLDALVFTAGVGEHSAGVRAGVCALLGFLGVELDAAANAASPPGADIAAEQASVRVFIVEAREDLVAAREARRALRAAGAP
jgi:acetate kinase